MKKVLTFSLLAALLSMAACNKTAAPESKEAPAVSAENGMLIVSVVPNDGAKATKADGNASRNYAVEAALWRAYLGTFMNMAQDQPLALIVVNHAREEAIEGTGMKTLGCGGGTQALL